jgi:hypothetical protein
MGKAPVTAYELLLRAWPIKRSDNDALRSKMHLIILLGLVVLKVL